MVLCCPLLCRAAADGSAPEEVIIAAGRFVPLVKTLGDSIAVQRFALDRYPVTRGEFRSFLDVHAEWWRAPVQPLYFDETYLSDWSDREQTPPPAAAPVTRVSWFAARAYCRSLGKRLPTAAEWEYAAQASEQLRDGRKDREFSARILRWYTERGNLDRPVGQWKNAWGVFDMHGMIWEWVEDFNGEFTTGDSRGDNSQDPNVVCGGAALNATDAQKVEYAAFMRYALRGSLEGRFSLRDLGFRCARSLP